MWTTLPNGALVWVKHVVPPTTTLLWYSMSKIEFIHVVKNEKFFQRMLLQCRVQFYLLPSPPPGHTPGDLQFCSNLAV